MAGPREGDIAAVHGGAPGWAGGDGDSGLTSLPGWAAHRLKKATLEEKGLRCLHPEVLIV